jgi:hypothetical protein
METTHPVKIEAAKRAFRMLDAAGVQYGAILDGEQYGALKVVMPARRQARYPRGSTRDYYGPFIEALEPGDHVDIPCGQFDVSILSSNVSAACAHRWGAGSYVTTLDRDANTVSVLRLF